MREAKQPEIRVNLDRKRMWEEVELARDRTINPIIRLKKAKEEKMKLLRQLNEELHKIVQMATTVLEE